MIYKKVVNIKIFLIFIFLLFTACATYTTKYAEEKPIIEKNSNHKSTHSKFYLVGNLGYDRDNAQKTLSAMQAYFDSTATTKDYLLVLGDNLYPGGMPSKDEGNRTAKEDQLKQQLNFLKGFKGKMIVIPGDRDWRKTGVKGVKREEKFVKKFLDDKKAFLPKDGCPLKSYDIDDDVHLLIVDSQWYIANWDKNPTINDECEIKTRDKFLTELQNELKKNKDKTIILAMHHPVYSNGPYGGKYSLRSHLFPLGKKIPLPILGTFITEIKSQGGISSQDILNKRYNDFMDRLSVMVRDTEKVIIVSAHENSLQYIVDNGLHQIIAGSGATATATTLGKTGKFAHSGIGFSVVDIQKNGGSQVSFYGTKERVVTPLYTAPIYDRFKPLDTTLFSKKFPAFKKASVYQKEEVIRSKAFRFIWGDHYRYIYGTKLKVPVVTLDTLMGGLTVDRSGGGQQTRSLRLLDTLGRRYSLRAVRKSATQFLQKGAFVNTYLDDNFDDTFTEELLADFYTASHPYATFIVGPLAEAIGVYHTNPTLYYIPKHPRLENYNESYGDELYVLEERPGKEFIDVPSFGEPDDIESTDDMLNKLRKDEKYQMDQSAYIRARLFDMLIGDWDRHTDQWRWARFDSNGKRVYRPIPRDRDQAFCNYDGALTNFVKLILPQTRKFEVYDEELTNVRWINESGIKLDRALVSEASETQWIAEANYIKSNLTDRKIDEAFNYFPEEIQDSIAQRIKKNLKLRRNQLTKIASKYHDYLARHVVITGTDKDDYFEIIRKDKMTEIKVSRIIKGEVKKQFFSKEIKTSLTNEIWIYGLDDDDQFVVKGKGRKPIKIRIIGGQNNDVYTIENGRKIKVYDHKTKPNTIKKKSGAYVQLSDNYNQNLYDPGKYIDYTNTITPLVGFNPDDGLNINVTDTYTKSGFYKEPFHNKHTLKAAYYLATNGYDLSYQGEFTNMIGNWNLLINGLYTSENFAQNFFGFGNTTENPDDDLGFDYNRTKTGIISFAIGVKKMGYYGAEVEMKTGFESVEVENSADRFITAASGLGTSDPEFFDRKKFTFIDVSYNYGSYDNLVNPSKGMGFALNTGVKMNVENTSNTFVYINPKIEFFNALTRSRKLVLKNEILGGVIIGDGFEFYQAPHLGGNNGLRGYRTERFTGDRALAFTNDLRYSFGKFKTGLLPLQLGIFGGYDIGRVWFDNEDSEIWHDNYGGGFWINAVDAIAGQAGLFYSDDGFRFSFGFGFNL
ncbi:metallophosphoesterase [Aquimarina brevivitae]|uniref:Calcineurin-like phosphoesterase family protein n=1 Tax=Aquimarina brevivitae TaxID=323412 RepID=A0A4Q7NTU4_9FLAO|nr:metallophosphoesterase [Aquimarina brevivitae]RZS90515.1 calcineurin-like phosphoesterase family protein [Aquimarina brevivitae]